jgi:hypothetical protein
MKDFLWQFGPAIIGVISAVVGGGTGGLAVGGIVGLALGGIALFIRYKLRQWGFDAAHQKQENQAAKDHGKIIKDEQEQSQSDKQAHDQSKKDKGAAFDT